MKPFNKTDAIQVLKRYRGADRLFRIDEHGVWPADEKKKKKDDAEVEEDGNWAAPESDQTETEESKFMHWRPASVFAHDPNPPNLSHTPMLPFPFTAGELAAFMVGGMGAAVAGHYGDWADGPDPDRLDDIPQHENFARLAVKEAYAARREAERIVGPQPLALYVAAEHARKAYNGEANIREGVSNSIPGTDDSSDRRARAVASIAKQDAEMESTAIAWKQGYEEWLNLMVRELLKPAPAQTAPAPVVTASDAPAKPTATIDRGWVMKRAALIEKHERQWPTINRDFQDASENGLSKSAKAPGHGDWFEADALIWARQRGKLSETTGQQTPSPATPFGGLTHRIKG